VQQFQWILRQYKFKAMVTCNHFNQTSFHSFTLTYVCETYNSTRSVGTTELYINNSLTRYPLMDTQTYLQCMHTYACKHTHTHTHIHGGARYHNFLYMIYCCLKYHDITNYHDTYTLCPANLSTCCTENL